VRKRINNAGATWGASFDDYPDEAWEKVMNLNVRSVFNFTQKLASKLEAAGEIGDPARVLVCYIIFYFYFVCLCSG
jgi:NAD(P)-dependent dehydrogenase (short-subunit alcohol dehydrogenase family)